MLESEACHFFGITWSSSNEEIIKRYLKWTLRVFTGNVLLLQVCMLIVEPFRVGSILNTDVSEHLFPNSIRIYLFT